MSWLTGYRDDRKCGEVLNHQLSAQSLLKQLAFVVTPPGTSLTLQAFTICEYANFIQRHQHPPPSWFPCALCLKRRDQHHGTKQMGLEIRKYSIIRKLEQIPGMSMQSTPLEVFGIWLDEARSANSALV